MALIGLDQITSMLDSDDGSISPYSPQIFQEIDCTIILFLSFGVWKMDSHTPQKHSAAITIFLSFYVKFKCNISVITHQGDINTACYASHPLEAMPSLCVRQYLQIRPMKLDLLFSLRMAHTHYPNCFMNKQ